jgi:hypothetical protein
MFRRILPFFSLSLLFAVGLALAGDSAAVPERPTDLRANTRYDGATAVAVLEWRDGSDNELGFEILRSDNSHDYRVVGMVGANTVRYEDKIGRYITGAFVYKVRAFNQVGKSEESNTVSVWF